jgi:adenylylsulfate kinase-like enzyme
VLLDRASIQLGIEKVAELFHEAGVLCLCAFSEPCHAERARLREQLPAGDFVEIQLGQLAPCEAAENPALVLASATEDLTGCVNRVLQFLEANDYVANASLT